MGIRHETHEVPAGRYESLYGNMPPHGLGVARGSEAAGGRGERAAERMASGRENG